MNSWRPFPLVICHILALLLIASWYLPSLRQLWEPLDAWVFFTLNGSLVDNHNRQLFWAAANTRFFDYCAAVIIALPYLLYIFSGTLEQSARRFAAGILILVATVLTIQFSANFLEYGRQGPSTSLEPAVLLTDIVTDFKFKAQSASSFPGDHGTALIMFCSMIWFFAGRRYALFLVFASPLFLLPRMVVGAHWLTDTLVGSVFVSLITLSWLLATPVHEYFVRWMTPYINKCWLLASRFWAK